MTNPENHFDIAIVGAGFGGLYMLVEARRRGFTARVFERGAGVGGTWYWNRYPGARCDAESISYSYSFSEDLQQDWTWSERFASQPEILAYLEHVADRFDLRRDIQFDANITAAVYDESTSQWRLAIDGHSSVTARYCVMATGCLSVSNTPEFPGLSTFKGRVVHTGDWPHEGLELRDRRVGVIGTGSSGIQVAPRIAEEAKTLTVFQRTPHFSLPARTRPLEPGEVRGVKENYPALREQMRWSPGGNLMPPPRESALDVDDATRVTTYERHWTAGGAGLLWSYNDILRDLEANRTVADFVRSKIAEIVEDPEVAAALMPDSYPIGAKRICLDTGYYEMFNRHNVELATVGDGEAVAFVPEGVTVGERVFPLDVAVLATGFDAMTGALNAIDIRGRGGQPLREKWRAGPRTLLGIATHGFPNLFMITGPGSPSVLSNMATSIEQHVEWLSRFLDHLRSRRVKAVEARQEAEDAWVQRVNDAAAESLLSQANSWYLGANVPGKPRVFMPYAGGVGEFRRICEDVAARGYLEFMTTSGAEIATADLIAAESTASNR